MLNELMGTIAGSQKDRSASFANTDSTRTVNLRSFDQLNQGRSGLEAAAYAGQLGQFNDLQNLLKFGPGQSEIQANTEFQNSFADQLQQLLRQSLNPTSSEISNNYSQAQQLFAPQQTALTQQFQDQNVASNRLAARLGRPGNDPILRNKLAQEQTRQQTMLNSQIGSYGMQLPELRGQQAMNLGGALSNLRSGLASQALQNRQTLLGMGSQLAEQERAYRLNTATTTGSQTTRGTETSGGGVKGAATGYQAGQAQTFQQAGQAMQMGAMFASDARLKKDIKTASVAINAFLDSLNAYQYQYVDSPSLPIGTQYGILAQDLEQTNVGRTMVVNTEQGKMINPKEGFGTVLAALAEINNRLKKLEER